MSDALAEEITNLARGAEIERVGPIRFRSCPVRRPLVISVVRNERRRIAEFLTHYRTIGAGHFIFIDNGSDDGTMDALANEPDVDLYRADGPFSAVAKHAWITRAVQTYGDRWYFLADADEHAVFEGVEDLESLARTTERFGRRRVRGALIDMYGDKPLARDQRGAGQLLLEAYPFFDGDGYEEHREHALTVRTGGPRRRALAFVDSAFAPQLTKYPLFRLRQGETLVSPHYIHPPISGDDPCWIGLLHFKFDGDTADRISDALVRGQYWQSSYEYRVYDEALKRVPDLSLMSPSSCRYSAPSHLVELGVIERIPRPSALQTLRAAGMRLLGP